MAKYGITDWSISTAQADTLYAPYIGSSLGCSGCLLASPFDDDTKLVWNLGSGQINLSDYYNGSYGTRPVVTLPSDIIGTVGDTVTIQK